MGAASYLIWEEKYHGKKVFTALGFFIFQLILNSLWTFIFFELKNPFLAFIEIIILLLTIITTVILFYRISKKAGIILIPYILWVGFALILNYLIYKLN